MMPYENCSNTLFQTYPKHVIEVLANEILTKKFEYNWPKAV